MRRVSDLPAPLQSTLDGTDLIVFDGECVLCSGFLRFMVQRDVTERFRFAIAQGQVGQALYGALDLPTDNFETNLVIVDGIIYERLDAFAAAMGALGGAWGLLAGLRYLPEPLNSTLYHLIARNRYRIFGRYDQCLIPDTTLRGRFVDGILS